MGTFAALYDTCSENNHIRGRQFERICKWYLENDPYYRHTVRKVWLWDDWDHRWGSDAGIDLVVEDSVGKAWAVQVKAYSPDHAVTKRDVDKVLSESSRKWFDYRLLIATTDRLHHSRIGLAKAMRKYDLRRVIASIRGCCEHRDSPPRCPTFSTGCLQKNDRPEHCGRVRLR
ncbi:restriction endonuclease [Rhodococcus sp. SORGH_AS_0303]|uniref:restriction endonuclease n=1 Tax=Rhodococcus sp. SORGH_AS_0303 TaxID=3041753 RepID=UPI002786100A|nr:restriction endonuclease [Rhodococcus sp. SORGH_AS_0303]MDQ1203197.1 putative helicase [Rhodococcus sp. SORGH_AS_0303]